jgi:hypothetical protein
MFFEGRGVEKPESGTLGLVLAMGPGIFLRTCNNTPGVVGNEREAAFTILLVLVMIECIRTGDLQEKSDVELAQGGIEFGRLATHKYMVDHVLPGLTS